MNNSPRWLGLSGLIFLIGVIAGISCSFAPIINTIKTSTIKTGDLSEKYDYLDLLRNSVLIYDEDFETIPEFVGVENYTNDQVISRISLNDNTLNWEVSSTNDSLVKFPMFTPPYDYSCDKFVEVNLRTPSSEPPKSVGLIIRDNNEGEFYYIGLYSLGIIRTYLVTNSDRQELTEPVRASLIMENYPNNLAVLQQAHHYVIFVNGKAVTEFSDDHLSDGKWTIGVELKSGEKTTIELSDVMFFYPENALDCAYSAYDNSAMTITPTFISVSTPVPTVVP